MIGIIPGRSARRTNLPAPASSFIGRERELADIGRLLRLHRLVLLTGPGGTGKTRLSLHAAAAELDRFADGVWLVELAPLASADLVADTIGQVLAGPMVPTTTELSPLERLCAVLRTRQLLLVLDNCEHVITACAQIVAQLLARQGGAIPAGQEAEAVVQPRVQIRHAHPPDPHGRQLQRQREAVQAAADVHHGGRVDLGETE